MTRRAPRWALSFADLCLLLTGFLVIVAARPEPSRLTDGLRQAFGANRLPRTERAAADLFEPGEAVMTASGATIVADFARTLGDAPVTLASRGTDAGGARLDGWELAAARTAAVARALAAEGIDEHRIALHLDGTIGGGQRLTIAAR